MTGILGWSETEFQKRVEARIVQLGRTENALLREAGLSGDEIRKVPKRGRRIDTIVGIARALNWTMGQALGIQDPTLFLEREREIDPAKLDRALTIAENVVNAHPGPVRSGAFADIVSLVYSFVSEQEALGRPLDEEALTSLLRRSFSA